MTRHLGAGRCAGWLLLLGALGCRADLTLPDGANVTCTSSADCPSGYTCVLEASRCVRSDRSFEVARVIADSVAIAPDLIARHTTSTLSFRLDSAVRTPPVVRILWPGGETTAPLRTSGTDGVTFEYTYTVGDAEPEGFASVVIDTVSDAGVPARFERPQAIVLDFTPPSIVPDTLSTTFSLPPAAVVDTVSALGLGGEASVIFALSELTRGLARLETDPAEALGQTCESPIGTLHRCRVPLAAPPAAQGPHTLFAVVEDLAGNSVRLDLGPLTLDTVPPAPPDTATPGRVVYTRVPQGAQDTQGLRRFSIVGSSGAVEAGARLVVFDGADVASASRIGVGQAGGRGEVASFPLVPADRSEVHVVAVDAAGNVSDGDPGTPGVQATRVRDVVWYATLAGKQALDPFSNPHRLRGYGLLPSALLGRSAAELSDVGTLGRSDGSGVQVEGAGTWSHLAPLSSPSNSIYLAYTDTWAGELRAIAVNSGGGDAWRFTGSAWEPVPLLDVEFDGSPQGANNGAAFDAQRGELVLVGSSSRSGDTWVFADQSWRFVPDSNGPAVDSGTMFYDDNRGQVLLFGGTDGTGPTSGTYAWDGATWTLLTTVGPEPRLGATAVFDPTLGKVVLFGGQGAVDHADTWLWDGSAWARRCDGVTADCGTEPTPRTGPALAYDPVRRRAVLFGGGYTASCGGDAMCTDFFEWDGSAWSRPVPVDPTGDGNAQGRVNHILGWDPMSSRLLVTGGEDEFTGCGPSSCRETWQWTGGDWVVIADPAHVAPTLRAHSLFAFDAARRELVFGGGINEFGDTTWVFNGRSWSSFTTGNPPAASYVSSASTPNGVFRYGGTPNGTTADLSDLYRRVGTTWTLMGATTKPIPRFDGATTYAAGATPAQLLLFGGALFTGPTVPTCPDVGGTGFCYLGDTWGWGPWGTPTCAAASASCWQQLSGTGPPRRYLSSLVATTGGEALLFGGQGAAGPLGDTWRWTGSAWVAVPGPGPAARRSHLSVFDARREKVVVAGGRTSDATTCGAKASGLACPDVWEFDGASWRQRAVADPENDGGFAEGTGRAVYWPGDGGMFTPDVTAFLGGRLWRWDGGFARRPGLVAEVDFDSSGAPADAIVDRVELRATARASSEVGGSASADVSLLAGEPLGWRTVDTATSGAAGVDLFYCASRSDVGAACQVRREGQLLLGSHRTLLLAAAPAGTNGRGVATVWLDYAEVRVYYRLPE